MSSIYPATMSFQDVGRRRMEEYNNRHELGLEKSSPIDEDDRARRLPKGKRSVRPRLETRCPVTSKALLDDSSITSFPSFKTQPSRESEEDDPSIPVVPTSPLSSRSQSIYSHLTSEIVNYQVRTVFPCGFVGRPYTSLRRLICLPLFLYRKWSPNSSLCWKFPVNLQKTNGGPAF